MRPARDSTRRPADRLRRVNSSRAGEPEAQVQVGPVQGERLDPDADPSWTRLGERQFAQTERVGRTRRVELDGLHGGCLSEFRTWPTARSTAGPCWRTRVAPICIRCVPASAHGRTLDGNRAIGSRLRQVGLARTMRDAFFARQFCPVSRRCRGNAKRRQKWATKRSCSQCRL